MNFDNHLFRASQLSNIIGNKKDVTKWLMDEYTCITEKIERPEFYSKYTEKGNETEQDGFDLIQLLHPKTLVVKNTSRASNGFVIGEHDTIVQDICYDIKNSYDVFTFNNANLSKPNEWQMKSYLWLNGLKYGRVVYCLVNMPEHLIFDEEKKLFYQSRKWLTMEDPDFYLACEEMRKLYVYDKPIEERMKIFEVGISNDDVEIIKNSVIAARKKLQQIHDEVQRNINKNKILLGHKNIVTEETINVELNFEEL